MTGGDMNRRALWVSVGTGAMILVLALPASGTGAGSSHRSQNSKKVNVQTTSSSGARDGGTSTDAGNPEDGGGPRSGTSDGGMSRDVPTPTPPMWLLGPIAKAVNVAADDLIAKEQRLLQQLEKSPPAAGVDPDAREIARCFARLESYDIQVREAEDRYVVYFLPNSSRCVKDGRHVLGGDATYELHKGDFRILSKDYGE